MNKAAKRTAKKVCKLILLSVLGHTVSGRVAAESRPWIPMQAFDSRHACAELDRARRLAPFSYSPFVKREINWKRIRALNIDRIVGAVCTS